MKNYLALFIISLLGIPSQLIAQPVISVKPASFNATINSCNDSSTATLTIINSGTSALDFEILDGEYAAYAELGYAYHCDRNSNWVEKVDINTNTVVGAPIPVGAAPWRTQITPNGKYVFVSNRNDDSISVIETGVDTVFTTIPVGVAPTGIAFTPDGQFAYVCNRGSDNVMKIDVSTFTVIATLTGAYFDPQDIVISPDGAFAYVTSSDHTIFAAGGPAGPSGQVSVIDLSSDLIIANIPVADPHSIAITPDGQFVYVTQAAGETTVTVIATATNTVLTQIGGFEASHGLDITPDGSKVYVIDQGLFSGFSTIKVIDVATNTIVAAIADPGLSFSWGLACGPYGEYVYVTNPWGAPDYFIIDIETNTVTTSFNPIGTTPFDVSILKGNATWIGQDILTGSVAANDSIEITVTFYAEGLANGTYNADIYIFSNDPGSLIDTIPVIVTVNGAPSLALSDTCLDLDTVGVGGSNAASYSISNKGCDTLIVTSITTASAEYTNDSVSLVIPPFQSRQVTVTFAPTAPGLYLDTIVILSNDVDTLICLTGFAEPAPAALFSPNPISASTTTCNDTIDVLLTISNTGGDTLNFSTWEQTDPPASEFAYIANFGNNSVEVLDLSTNALVASIPVGTSPIRLSFHPGGQLVYCSNGRSGSDDISVIQVSDNTVIATIPVGTNPRGMAFTPDGTFGYVANRNSDNVSKINCITQNVVATIPLTGGVDPMDIVVTPDGKYAYVATKYGGIDIIDIASDLVVGTVAGVIGCHSIIGTPDGRYLYVTEGDGINTGGVAVRVIETASNTVVDAIALNNPHAMAITQDGSKIYVANKNVNQIAVIDVATNTVISTISDLAFTSGWGVWGIALSPDDEYVYLNMPWGGSPNYAVIETATENVVATFDVPGNSGFEIATLRSGLPWLTAAPDSGSVPPGGDTTITVQLNGFGLPSGTHTGNVVFSSNDPNSPQYVPVTFTIDGVPFIDLSASCLDLDTAQEFSTKVDSFLIYNLGCDTLFITDANNALGEFTLSDTSGFVEPYDSVYVRVTFAPRYHYHL